MMACETWLARDFLVRHSRDPGPPCSHDHDQCPEIGEIHMDQMPAITKASVKVAVTFADGTSRDYDFELDTVPGEDCPITFAMEADNDIRDVTDVEVDSFRRMALGDRRRIALSIGGRGPMPAKAGN